MLGEVVDGSQGLLRRVASGSEHLTHVFLGERDASPSDVLKALKPVERLRRFHIRLGGARVFMGRGNPRLVCLDVLEGEDAISDLADRTRRALEALFPELAGYRLKKPHVTLARFSRRARRSDGRRVEDALGSAALGAWQGEDSIERVELIMSQLTAAGARYETLGSVALRP